MEYIKARGLHMRAWDS